MKYSWLIIALLFTIPSLAKRKIESFAPISASEIISKSESAYKNLKIYLDSGKLISEFYNTDHPNKSAIYFKTAYSNTGNFNFESYESGKSNSLYVINRTGKVIRSWWGINDETKTFSDLKKPLSIAVGVSSGISRMIPGLLLSEEFNGVKNTYRSLDSLVVGMEIINGIDCYTLSGVSLRNTKTIIWISKKDFLIRKLVTDKTITAEEIIVTRKLAMAAMKDKMKSSPAIDYLNSTKPHNLSIKATYLFYPYFPKTVDKTLFAFRPNREVPI